jgi:4-carboxymuconolactone decarboxylase
VFGNVFNKDGLDARTRLLVILAGLVATGAHAEPQIKMTVRHALEAGGTEKEIAEVIYQMSMLGGLPAMTRALELAQSVFDEKQEGDA